MTACGPPGPGSTGWKTRQVSSTSSQDPGTRPTVSRPMSSVSGCRPVAANSTSPAFTSPPSSRVDDDRPGAARRGATAATVMPIRTSTPASARARPTSSPANGSIRAAGRRPGQQGDRGTQARRAGHFHADPAADDDGQPSGHGAGAGGVPVGPRSRLGQAGQFGQGRCTARPRAGRSEPPSRRPGGHGDPAVAVQPAVPADQFGAEAFQPGGLPLVVPAGHPSVATGEAPEYPPPR